MGPTDMAVREAFNSVSLLRASQALSDPAVRSADYGLSRTILRKLQEKPVGRDFLYNVMGCAKPFLQVMPSCWGSFSSHARVLAKANYDSLRGHFEQMAKLTKYGSELLELLCPDGLLQEEPPRHAMGKLWVDFKREENIVVCMGYDFELSSLSEITARLLESQLAMALEIARTWVEQTRPELKAVWLEVWIRDGENPSKPYLLYTRQL